MRAALLISGADRRKCRKLKVELANNYLLGTDQYPDTLDRVARILANYQNTREALPYKASPNDSGVAFLQQAGQGDRGAGHGGQGGCGEKGEKSKDCGTCDRAGDNNVSTMRGRTGMNGAKTKTNSRGESHCFNCESPSHLAYECLQLSREQQSQLHMNIEAQGEADQEKVEGAHQLLSVTLAQGGALPDNWAYLDGCSTATAFKSRKYLKGIKGVQRGIKINYNAGTVVTNKRGAYSRLKVCYLLDGIADIFS